MLFRSEGTDAYDDDNDGWTEDEGTTACSRPVGYADNYEDCDDTDPTSYPGAPEDCDGEDDNCDDVVDDGAECDCPLWNRGTHAYLVCSDDPASWNAAEFLCESYGYELVDFGSSSEETDIWYILRTYYGDADWWRRGAAFAAST